MQASRRSARSRRGHNRSVRHKREAAAASKGVARWWPKFDLVGVREVTSLAWPIALAMAGDTLMGLVDTKLVGALGATALGGVGLATNLMFVAYALVYGALRGVKVRTAHAMGEGTPEDGYRYAAVGAMFGFVAGCLVYWVGRDITWALWLLRVDPALVPPTRDFFAAVTCGSPFAFAAQAFIQHRQASFDAKTPMVVGLAGNVVNAVLAYALIHGHLGLSALGVRGAGFGTAITQALTASILLALFLRSRATAKQSALSRRVALGRVLSIGIPTGVQFWAETLAFVTFTVVLSGLGTSELAAHQLSLAVIRTSFLPGLAIGEAACVLVGRSLGEGRLSQADRHTESALVVAMAYMGCCAIVFGVFGSSIARVFTSEDAVLAIARKLLLVACMFQLLDAVNVTLRGALRGAKDVRATAIIGTLVIWAFVPTSAYFLGKVLGLGALGGWIGFLAETSVAAALFWLRWRRGSWRKAYEPHRTQSISPRSATAVTAASGIPTPVGA